MRKTLRSRRGAETAGAGRNGGTLVRSPARHTCREQMKGSRGQGGDGEQAASDTGVRERETGPGGSVRPNGLARRKRLKGRKGSRPA